MKGFRASIAKKTTTIFVCMVFVSSLAVGLFGYFLYRGDSIQAGADKALAIADSVAASIDADQFVATLASGEENAYWETEAAYVNDVAARTGTEYIYVLDANYDDQVYYFAEGVDTSITSSDFRLGTTEAIVGEDGEDIYAVEMFDTIRTGQPTVTEAYPSGEYGTMVSGFAPILADDGTVVGVVGVDLSIQSVTAAANTFGLITIIIVLSFSVVFGIASWLFVSKTIGKPIKAVTEASGKIAKGDMDVDIRTKSIDEIGQLAEAFRTMAAATRVQVEALERLAHGDLTVDVQRRSDKDLMSISMQETIDNLNRLFKEIYAGTEQVSNASDQIASSAQSLAQGAIEQAGTVDHLAITIAEVADKTQENAQQATKAAQLAGTIRDNAETGKGQMEQMVQAVREIDEASQSIGKVIKVIDDIAFQTNILALNAAVEAARAGQYGKGFAVVADEVRSLAAKSAASAKDTASLIENSLEKTALGVKIAGETASSLDEIVSGVNESGQIVENIAKASEEQSTSLLEINASVEQVSHVVQQNSAAAEQSAATSEEMSGQASSLQSLLSQFRLKSGGAELPAGNPSPVKALPESIPEPELAQLPVAPAPGEPLF